MKTPHTNQWYSYVLVYRCFNLTKKTLYMVIEANILLKLQRALTHHLHKTYDAITIHINVYYSEKAISYVAYHGPIVLPLSGCRFASFPMSDRKCDHDITKLGSQHFKIAIHSEHSTTSLTQSRKWVVNPIVKSSQRRWCRYRNRDCSMRTI